MSAYAPAPALPGDLDEMCELVDRCDVHDLGRPDYAGFSVRPPWLDGTLDPARDALVVRTPGGQAVAYVQSVGGEVLGRVAPEHRGRGLGTLLLDHVERHATGPLEQEIGGENDAAVHLLQSRGWALQWTSWYFRRPLDGPVPEPVWPPGVVVRPLRRGDDEAPVHAMLTEAFAENRDDELPPRPVWVAHDLDTPRFDPSTSAVVEEDGRVVGLCLAYPDPGEAWIKLLAVHPSMRGRGLGLALLHAAFGELQRRGHPSVGLEMDAANPTSARHLYLRAGMVQERRNRFLRRDAP
jgi:GNAT superfamily N-acetyltransferase